MLSYLCFRSFSLYNRYVLILADDKYLIAIPQTEVQMIQTPWGLFQAEWRRDQAKENNRPKYEAIISDASRSTPSTAIKLSLPVSSRRRRALRSAGNDLDRIKIQSIGTHLRRFLRERFLCSARSGSNDYLEAWLLTTTRPPSPWKASGDGGVRWANPSIAKPSAC
jgi:hypothetical protein